MSLRPQILWWKDAIKTADVSESCLWQNNSNIFVKISALFITLAKMGQPDCTFWGKLWHREDWLWGSDIFAWVNMVIWLWPDDPGACVPLGVKPSINTYWPINITGDAWSWSVGCVGLCWSLRQQCPLLVSVGAVRPWVDADWSLLLSRGKQPAWTGLVWF